MSENLLYLKVMCPKKNTPHTTNLEKAVTEENSMLNSLKIIYNLFLTNIKEF